MKLITPTACLLMLLLGMVPRVSTAAPSEIDHGQDVFEANCASCHGYEGRGNGPNAKMFDPRPADLTKPTLKHGNTDAEIINIISGGSPGTAMQAWKPKLSDDDIKAVLAYIKVLRKAPSPK